ncbi:ABC transporter substrate-binding protein, partial [Escherichia coli]|nr:ABC transporter substrate-binding protein [Escherichia coli]
MRKFAASLTAFAVCLCAGSAMAADPIRVGIVGTMSGPYALFGQNFKRGID